MEVFKKKCPACQSDEINVHSTYQTINHGKRTMYECTQCAQSFSETRSTFLEGLKTPLSVIWQILEVRTEGMGLNATARVCKNAKNTILGWERRVAELHTVLLVYSLVHQFLQLVLEGDEAYTKVNKNVPPEQSQGWTIALMDRASRFLWELDCGKREKSLVQQAVETLAQVIEQTQDVSLFTDGERRYGNLLFEICRELVRTGKRGRPKTTLTQGVKARVKNKGSQTRKRGRKRPKYPSPWAEHPKTPQNIETSMIHANHLEAFFSSLRRKCAPYRRRTNMYATSQGGLRRILRVYWGMHNFVREHFTTKEVPAVGLGVLQKSISEEELCLIQMV